MKVRTGKEFDFARILSIDWICVMCKEDIVGALMFKDLLVGGKKGICFKYQDRIEEANPDLKASRIKTEARLAVSRGTPDILKHAQRYQSSPGWWISSLPKSWV